MRSHSNRRGVYWVLATALLAVTAGCSTLQPPDPNGPRGSESVYPVVYTADEVRRNEVTATLGRFIQPTNTGIGPQLQPVTLTIESLGPAPTQPLYLPKLGTAAVMTEEETRESLRRFIRDWQQLIGSDPTKLSLVERLDQSDGTKLANYEQRPFRYPIRGNFGELQIRFATDRRVLSMTSTCIPNADRVQSALAGMTVKLTAEDAISQVVNKSVPARDAKPAFSVQASQVTARELVTYVQPSTRNPEALEFHIAWELSLKNAPAQSVYVDAVTGDIIAAD